MIAQSTGLRTREQVAAAVSDLNTLARYDYLVSVTIYLLDKAGGMERQLFTTLKADGRLLEQERISLSYAKQKLQTALNPELEQTVVSP